MKTLALLLLLAPAALAQNVAQPWHEPYVGQLVSCKPHPINPANVLGAYTFDGIVALDFEFPVGKGCPMRIEITPQPRAPATQNPRGANAPPPKK